MVRLFASLPLTLLLAACGSSDGASGNDDGTGGTAGSSTGSPGCTKAPDCGGCGQNCLALCLCHGGDGPSCESSCGVGVGGTPGTGGSGGTSGGTGGVGGSMGGAGGTATGGTGGSPFGVVRLVAVGDTGEGNAVQRAVAQQMDAKCAQVGCDAVVMLGDNFYDVGVTSTGDPQWGPKFEDVYDLPSLNGLKFYATLGNHDYGPTSSGSSQAQIDYTYLPVGTGPGMRPSDKWAMFDRWYDIRIGHVHFFSMDTQDYSDVQKQDLGARIDASDAAWKFVFGHHPRYTSGFHALDNPALGAQGMYATQEFLFCKADFFLTGHDHNHEFLDRGTHPPCPQVFFVVSGAGAKLRGGLLPAPGSVYFNDKVEGFAYLEFSDATLDLQMIDKAGQLLFQRKITK